MEILKEIDGDYDFDTEDRYTPFELPLIQNFSHGSKLIVRGTPFEGDTERFAINLECSGRRNTALHLNPRFHERVLVRNSKDEDGWNSDEERSGPWLFEPGEEFKMKIKCKDDEFKIKVNGEKVPSFTHRLSPDAITHLSFGGDVHIKEATYEPSGTDEAVQFDDLKHFPVPFEIPLKHNFPPGSKITIKGKPFEGNPNRFHINFEWPRVIALHLNPRFDEGTFLRNWKGGNGWDENDEERNGPFSFAPGEEFKLKIKCKDDEFKIKLNGEKVPGFEHRVHPSEITHIAFTGDVNIRKVEYNPAR